MFNNGAFPEVSDVPTLLMMHGMTGTAAMMREFAERILPEGWTLLVPEGRYAHPRRGFSWWRYEDWNAPPSERGDLSRMELMDVDASLAQLEQDVSHHAPAGPLVVGGFSMGGAMAQEMLHLPLAERIIGVIALGTRLVRPMELRIRLEEVEPKHLFWMHGTRDVRVPIEDGWAVAHLFEAAGWATELIEHGKGHMIPTEHHEAVREWLVAIERDWEERVHRR